MKSQENTKWKWWNWCLAYRILLSKNLHHQYLFITTVLLQVEIHHLFSKFLFIKITSLQKGKEAARIRFLFAMCYKRHPVQRIILHGLPIKKNITSKQWMFYQSNSILMNWKVARKTKVWHLFKAFVFLLTCSKYIPNRNSQSKFPLIEFIFLK